MASDERMADGTTGPGPEQAPPGSRPFSSEIPKNPFGPEASKDKKYPPGTTFTKKGNPIFRMAGGEPEPGEDIPDDDVTPDSPSDPTRLNREREDYRRSRDAEAGFPEEEVRKYTQDVADEGKEQSFYNIYQELEHYKQNRQFGKLRQRVNNILATLDIDEAGEAPGIGELLQYMNVVFAEPQYEAFRSEISNWIEARQITHNVAFAAKYLKCEQWGSGITNIRGRHLKALMRDSGVQQASDLLEDSNDDENPPTGARGHYYRVKDEGIKDPDLVRKIIDGQTLTAAEKKDSWTLRQKIKLIDKMWDDFGVGEDGEPKDFLGMTDVFKMAGLFDKDGLVGFPDKSLFYSDEGVFKEFEYKQALKKFYSSTDMEEAQKKIDKARKDFRPLLIYGMNYMISSDQLDKYHSAHRALSRIKQDGEEGDAQKKGLFKDLNGKKIVSKSVKGYLEHSEKVEVKYAEVLQKLVEEAVSSKISEKITADNAERRGRGEPEYTEAEQKEQEEKLKAEYTPGMIAELRGEHGKAMDEAIDKEKAEYIISKNLKKEDITDIDIKELSDVHLEDIEQVFGHLNRAFVIAEKMHHASGQSADFDGLIWKQGVEIPEELRGSMAQYGYENRSGGAVIFDPVIEWYDDKTRDIDPETGKNRMFSGEKITLHLVADMMPEKEGDSEETKRRKRIAKQLARERSGQLAKAWADHQRMIYEKYAHLIDFNASIGGRGARDKKKLHHKPADYWNDGELNPGHFAELRQYGYVNTVTIQQFFELGTNAQLAEEWDRFFNRIKYNTGRWNAMEKVQGMFDKSGPRLLYDFHAMETPDQIIKTLGEFFKASMALTEFDDEGATEVNEFIGSLARGIFKFRTKDSEKYDFENLNWNQLDLLSRKLTLSHMVSHHEAEHLNREYLGNDLYQFMRDLYEKTNKRGLFAGFIEELLKQLAATSQAFTKG